MMFQLVMVTVGLVPSNTRHSSGPVVQPVWDGFASETRHHIICGCVAVAGSLSPPACAALSALKHPSVKWSLDRCGVRFERYPGDLTQIPPSPPCNNKGMRLPPNLHSVR